MLNLMINIYYKYIFYIHYELSYNYGCYFVTKSIKIKKYEIYNSNKIYLRYFSLNSDTLIVSVLYFSAF